MADPSTQASAQESKGGISDFLSGRTPGVKGIEAAYSRAGATNHHTPGVATKLGSQHQGDTSEHQGVGSKKFGDNISDQRQEPTVVGKIFNNMINGTDSTK